MIKRDTKKTQINKKSDFLNADQRKELKRRLTDKFTKLYAYANPARAKEIIDTFFAQTAELNSKKLAELELMVKKDALAYKSLTKSRPSNVQPQHVTPEASVQLEDPTPKHSVAQSVRSDEDDREDHWDSVGMYQALLLKQEQDLAATRKQLQQKTVKSQLDAQINEKARRANRNADEHQAYVNTEQQMLDNHRVRAEEEERVRKADKEHLKSMQLHAIEERNRQLEAEKLRDKNLDDKIVQCLNDDLSRQRQLQMVRAEEKKRESQALMDENEMRKQKRLENERKIRQEDIELQKAANDVQDELDRRRQAQQKTKHDKIQQLLAVGEKVVKTQQDKNTAEEQRIQKYQDKKNREAAKKEARMRDLELANRNKYRDFLDQQIREKDEKTRAQDEYVREQADIWKRSDQVYSVVNTQNKENSKANMEEYKKELERQIVERTEKEKRAKQADRPNEEAMKLALMARIHELDIKKRVLAEQMNGVSLK